jgi:diaminohydroxyphosphoribosylaminopyrimidine deaminase/5-amino-6-(5-phosphoribosylamino)uracil reductase
VKDIIGEGYHIKRGEKHAEVCALNNCQENLSEATLYCTLEPCSKTYPGKIQPLCTDAIISSGIKTVVIGILDPMIDNNAIRILKDKNIDVTLLNDNRVHHSLRYYLHHRKTYTPYVTLKAAISLDGKIVPSSLLTSYPELIHDVNNIQLKYQAILMDAETALEYNTSNNISPLKCIIDFYGKFISGPLFNTSLGPIYIFTSANCPITSLELWKEKGLHKIVYINNLIDILSFLGQNGIVRLLIEGNTQLITSFITENLVNELIIYNIPKLLGNSGSLFYSDNKDALSAKTITSQQLLNIRKIKQLGPVIRIRYII